jgi:hypothetical protein
MPNFGQHSTVYNLAVCSDRGRGFFPGENLESPAAYSQQPKLESEVTLNAIQCRAASNTPVRAAAFSLAGPGFSPANTTPQK